MRSYTDISAFTKLSCAHAEILELSSNFLQLPDILVLPRFSCSHVPKLVRLPDFCAFIFRLSCVHQTFVAIMLRLFSFIRLRGTHQTFVSSCPDFCAFTGLSCNLQKFVRSCSDFHAFTRLIALMLRLSLFILKSSEFWLSELKLPLEWVLRSKSARSHLIDNSLYNKAEKNSTPKCIHVQTFASSCPDFLVFISSRSCVHDQTFVRFSIIPDDCERTIPPFMRSSFV